MRVMFPGRAAAAAALCAGLFLGSAAANAQGGGGGGAPSARVADLQAALADRSLSGEALAQKFREAFGAKALATGANPRVDDNPAGLLVGWAIEAPGLTAADAPPMVVSDDGTFRLKLNRVGTSDIYAAFVPEPQGMAVSYAYVVGGKRIGGEGRHFERYPRQPEEYPNPSMPHGKLTQMPAWNSKIFEDTTRDWWVYVPAQYDPSKPPAVMVFQDGGDPKNWMPTIFDNMIAKGEIPPTVGIFINPGNYISHRGSNRSIEYDTLSDKYARFLLEEILPEVEKTTKLSHDPEMRALYGVSSGGICAFTVAWERPNEFRKVITAVGSFTNLQGGPTGSAGGNTYPAIIRKWAGWNHEGKPKPIRVFQSDGANDLDNAAGNWPLANQEISKALTYGGYDHKLVFGNGFHGGSYGRYLMPDSLRWIWHPAAAESK